VREARAASSKAHSAAYRRPEYQDFAGRAPALLQAAESVARVADRLGLRLEMHEALWSIDGVAIGIEFGNGWIARDALHRLDEQTARDLAEYRDPKRDRTDTRPRTVRQNHERIREVFASHVPGFFERWTERDAGGAPSRSLAADARFEVRCA